MNYKERILSQVDEMEAIIQKHCDEASNDIAKSIYNSSLQTIRACKAVIEKESYSSEEERRDIVEKLKVEITASATGTTTPESTQEVTIR